MKEGVRIVEERVLTTSIEKAKQIAQELEPSIRGWRTYHDTPTLFAILGDWPATMYLITPTNVRS